METNRGVGLPRKPRCGVHLGNILVTVKCSLVTLAGITEQGVTDPLPKHLKEHERLPLQEVPESIYEKTSMGASSFSLFLHQNYLAFFSDIDCVAKAAHYLSDSDVLSAYWMVSSHYCYYIITIITSDCSSFIVPLSFSRGWTGNDPLLSCSAQGHLLPSFQHF